MTTATQSPADYAKSLDNWPVSFIPKREVLRSHLFYTGTDDILQCKHCKIQLGKWELDDDPIEAHIDFSPECEHIKSLVSANNARKNKIGPSGLNSTKGTLQKRLTTFKHFPPGIKVSIWALAEAGFFYARIGGKVMCFCCGGQLKDCEEDDVPWRDHAYFFPGCLYVELIKGSAFVRDVLENGRHASDIVCNNYSEILPSQILSEPCITCGVKNKESCLVPCGHTLACDDCSLALSKCPGCNEPISNVVKIALE